MLMCEFFFFLPVLPRKDKSLGIMSQRFLMLFLVSKVRLIYFKACNYSCTMYIGCSSGNWSNLKKCMMCSISSIDLKLTFFDRRWRRKSPMGLSHDSSDVCRFLPFLTFNFPTHISPHWVQLKLMQILAYILCLRCPKF